jgi:hypothetical protein
VVDIEHAAFLLPSGDDDRVEMARVDRMRPHVDIDEIATQVKCKEGGLNGARMMNVEPCQCCRSSLTLGRLPFLRVYMSPRLT